MRGATVPACGMRIGAVVRHCGKPVARSRKPIGALGPFLPFGYGECSQSQKTEAAVRASRSILPTVGWRLSASFRMSFGSQCP